MPTLQLADSQQLHGHFHQKLGQLLSWSSKGNTCTAVIFLLKGQKLSIVINMCIYTEKITEP